MARAAAMNVLDQRVDPCPGIGPAHDSLQNGKGLAGDIVGGAPTTRVGRIESPGDFDDVFGQPTTRCKREPTAAMPCIERS